MSSWTPILAKGPIADAAWQAVDAVVESVRDGRADSAPHEEALLLGYLAAARTDVGIAERAADRLNVAVDAVQKAGRLSLYGGLSGLGWTIEHLTALLDEHFPSEADETEPAASTDAEDGDPASEIDAVILRELGRTRPGSWSRQYDLISGLVGYGAYFLERWPRPSAVQGLQLVATHLEGLAERMTPGIAWHTGAELLPDFQRRRCPTGYFNLGVAHGIPGILHLLSEIAAIDIERERVVPLLEGGVEWLMAQRRPPGSLSLFSTWVAPGESSDSRMGWCYGDLGIAAVLLQVARRARREDWSRFAHEVLDHCLAWPVEQSRVDDAPLCHGAVGVAHIFNRAYQAEGDPRCRDAAGRWYERALAMRRPGEGVGGFFALQRPDPNGPLVSEPTADFLDGAIGVALGFLAALTPVEPRWDRLLLLSGRS